MRHGLLVGLVLLSRDDIFVAFRSAEGSWDPAQRIDDGGVERQYAPDERAPASP